MMSAHRTREEAIDSACAGPVSSKTLASPQPYTRRRKRRFRLRPFIVASAVPLTLLIIAAIGFVYDRALQELGAANWTTYVSQDGGFSIRLPEDAFSRKVKQKRRMEINTGLSRPHIFDGVILSDGTRVGVFYYDSPSPTSDPLMLKRLMRMLERQFHGDATLKMEGEITFGDCPAIETVYERQKGSLSVPVYGRWCLADNRVYEVAWMPARDEPSEESRQIFWDSFQLLASDS